MAYQHQGSCASAGDTLELLAFDDEFDPLAVDDSEIDQEWMDDENPYDTIDYPTMRNMPETVHHDPVYSPARQGSATEALQALIVRNPNRRPVLLNIIGLCEGGCASSIISERVDEWQRDNWSVYAPMTLCRMLERAGALVLEMPEVTDEPRERRGRRELPGDSRDRGSGVALDARSLGPARGIPRWQELPAQSFWAPTRRATPRCTARSWRRSPRRPGSWSTSRA